MQYRNIIIALVFAACTGGAAMANDDVPVETKREFREKVAQRNRIIRELAKIEEEPAAPLILFTLLATLLLLPIL